MDSIIKTNVFVANNFTNRLTQLMLMLCPFQAFYFTSQQFLRSIVVHHIIICYPKCIIMHCSIVSIKHALSFRVYSDRISYYKTFHRDFIIITEECIVPHNILQMSTFTVALFLYIKEYPYSKTVHVVKKIIDMIGLKSRQSRKTKPPTISLFSNRRTQAHRVRV